jgi:beta-glucanase (GH16 family)
MIRRSVRGENAANRSIQTRHTGGRPTACRLARVLPLGVAVIAALAVVGGGFHASAATVLKRHCGTTHQRKRCRRRDPSGQPAPKGNLPGWRLVFVDEFRSRIPLGAFSRRARWKAYAYPSRDTSQNGTYWPQQGLSTHNGVLDIWLHTVMVGGTEVHVVNAPQPVLPGPERGQLYGRYAIRFKADPVPGYKTAWLLWPDSGRRSDGEIDFPEGNLTGTFSAYVHPVNAVSGSDSTAYATNATYRRWHTAVIVWTPGRCRFILDGKQVGVDTQDIPDTPMHWVLQTETQLYGGPPANDASGHVYIDWVAVYARR